MPNALANRLDRNGCRVEGRGGGGKKKLEFKLHVNGPAIAQRYPARKRGMESVTRYIRLLPGKSRSDTRIYIKHTNCILPAISLKLFTLSTLAVSRAHARAGTYATRSSSRPRRINIRRVKKKRGGGGKKPERPLRSVLDSGNF